jgi:hypothetical protein
MAAGGKPKFPLYFVAPFRDSLAYAHISALYQEIRSSKKKAADADSSAVGTIDSNGVHEGDGSHNRKNNDFLSKLETHGVFQNNTLVVTGTVERSQGWFSNTERRNTSFISERMRANPFSMLIDFHAAAHFFLSMSQGQEPSGKDKKMIDILNALDHLEVTGGAVRSGKAEMFMELRLSNSSPDALRNFIHMLH